MNGLFCFVALARSR